MTKAKPMTVLYRRLSVLGFTRAYVKELALPEWWDDSIAETPAGFAEGALYLSRHLGISYKSLVDDRIPLSLRDFGTCKFKKTLGTTEDELAVARTLGTRLAQIAAYATPTPSTTLPDSALEIRLRILEESRYVSLESLLAFCWSMGVPVVFLSRLPKGCKKMHGLSAIIDGRPVIVLSRNYKPSAWLLFVLAHELGHIVLNHLADGGVLLDESVEGNVKDPEERQADAFAIELLTGHPEFQVGTDTQWPNHQTLAAEAKAFGEQRRIDPGHIVLNFVHTIGGGFYHVAHLALKLLEPDGDGPKTIRTAMAEHLDWSGLPAESSRFLLAMTDEA